MKSTFISLFLVLYTTVFFAQRYIPGEDAFTYKMNGIIYMSEFDVDKKELVEGIRYAQNLLFRIEGTYNQEQELKAEDDDGNNKKVNTEYYILSLAAFTYDQQLTPSEVTALTEGTQKFTEYTETKIDSTYEPFASWSKKKIKWYPVDSFKIDRGDIGKYFAVKVSDFDAHIENKRILKRYSTGFKNYGLKAAYGAQLSVPFKIRPVINDEPLRLTPEISLGGFVGARVRVKKYEDSFWIPIFASVGVSAIGIDRENSIDESMTTGENQVLALNYSIGSVFIFKGFQIGLVTGWDKAAGDLGRNWVYQGRPWYSLAIGYSFLNLAKNDAPNSNATPNN